MNDQHHNGDDDNETIDKLIYHHAMAKAYNDLSDRSVTTALKEKYAGIAKQHIKAADATGRHLNGGFTDEVVDRVVAMAEELAQRFPDQILSQIEFMTKTEFGKMLDDNPKLKAMVFKGIFGDSK